MRIAILLVFVAVPLLEIALLIRAGQEFGFWPTFAVVVGTAIAGTYLLRQQGFHILGRLTQDLSQGRPPLEPIADGAMILVAGAFLMTPGFVTDAAGFLLLVPQFRAFIRRAIVARLLASAKVDVTVFTDEHQTDVRSGNGRPAGSGSTAGPVIEGEFERINEPSRDPRRGKRS